MLPDNIEHCIVFMNYWDVSGVFWSFSKCKIKIPHLPADPSTVYRCRLSAQICYCGGGAACAPMPVRCVLPVLSEYCD